MVLRGLNRCETTQMREAVREGDVARGSLFSRCKPSLSRYSKENITCPAHPFPGNGCSCRWCDRSPLPVVSNRTSVVQCLLSSVLLGVGTFHTGQCSVSRDFSAKAEYGMPQQPLRFFDQLHRCILNDS